MSKNVIIHGDSRHYIPKIERRVNCVLTDPPYGMNYESNSAQTTHGKEYTKALQGDMTIPEALGLFYSVMGPIVDKLADEAEIYVFTAWHILEWWIPACKNLAFISPTGHIENRWTLNAKGKPAPENPKGPDNGIRLKQMIVWNKEDPGQGDLLGNWGCGHEVALYLKKGRREVPRRRSAILTHPKLPAGKNIHPTEKPVALLRDLLEMSTSPGDLVVDPFSGSGSTSAAAQQLGRDSLAFEIDERYIARSRGRLEEVSLFSAT